jgi:hypothetical protein
MVTNADNGLVYSHKGRKISLRSLRSQSSQSSLVYFFVYLACGFIGSAQAIPITFLATDTGGGLSHWFMVGLSDTAGESVLAFRSSGIVYAAVPESSAIALMAFSLFDFGVMPQRQERKCSAE